MITLPLVGKPNTFKLFSRDQVFHGWEGTQAV